MPIRAEFDNYHDAYNHAELVAACYGLAVGIEAPTTYDRKWRTLGVPTPKAKRFGFETRIEVVEPDSPFVVARRKLIKKEN